MGPVVALVVRQELTQEEVRRVQAILKRAGGIRICAVDRRAPADPDSLGTYRHPKINSGEFVTSLTRVDQDERAEGRDQFEVAIGWWPVQSFQLSAGCNDAASHRILGRSMCALAEDLGGMIDLMGAITPPLSPERGTLPVLEWHSLDEVSAFVHGFPGTVHESFYKTGNGKLWVHHYVDAEFMQAWLRHRHFHLVK